MAIFTIATE